jgi:hypothetical protein
MGIKKPINIFLSSCILGLIKSPQIVITLVITLLNSFLETTVFTFQGHNSFITHRKEMLFISVVSCLS